jgi:putative tributyrin esterase
MARLRCSFSSSALSLETSMTVILPEPTGPTVEAVDQSPLPVLYLLHGLTGDDSSWVRRTSIERYVEPLQLAVVLPQVHRSYYTDEAYGARYWTFLTSELPRLVEGWFRLSPRREDTFVAGLSMGGYGAFKWALREPGRFAAAASLSGALDIASPRSGRFRPDDPQMFRRIFGEDPIAGSQEDLITLVAQADPAVLPKLGLWCGTEDGTLPANRTFADACIAANVSLDVDLSPGDHEWDYWDATIQQVLAWLPLQGRAD